MQTDSKTDSKSALLRRLISEHGPISTANLLGLANAEGGSIPRKSVASLLATAVKNGTVVKVDMGDEIQWGTPDQVAACSGLDAEDTALHAAWIARAKDLAKEYGECGRSLGAWQAFVAHLEVMPASLVDNMAASDAPPPANAERLAAANRALWQQLDF